MKSSVDLVPLQNLLTPISRPETVSPENLYRILGAHSYAQGLYIKEAKFGAEIRADKMYRIEQGDFVYSRLFAWRGSFALATEENHDCYVSNEFPSFTININQVNPKYLLRFFNRASVWEEAFGLSSGSTPISRNRLKEDKLLSIRIPLPPLQEQQRIVARIEELAAKIEEARILRRDVIKVTKTFLASAVDEVLNGYRKKFQNVSLEAIALSISDGDHQPPPKSETGIPFLFISHVVSGKLSFSDCLWVPVEYYSSLPKQRVPKKGDILYTTVGSYGVPCLVDTDELFCFQRHIALIKPDTNMVMPEYLTWVLSSSEVFAQATKSATGSAQLTVPLRGIRNLQFTLPSLTEQQKIVAYLDDLKSKMDILRRMQAETSMELDALLPSILDKAFKGEL